MSKLSPTKQMLLGWLTALLVFALLFAAGKVAAQQVFSPEDAVAEVGQSEAPGSATGEAVSALAGVSGVLQVFSTNSSYNGAGPAGYARSGMDAACRAQDSESHFCTLQEIENAWKTGGVNFILTGQSWVDNAVTGTIDPGYTGDFQVVSDWYGGNADGDHPYNCNAWTNSTNPARGLIINSGAISPAVEACDDIHPISCCK